MMQSRITILIIVFLFGFNSYSQERTNSIAFGIKTFNRFEKLSELVSFKSMDHGAFDKGYQPNIGLFSYTERSAYRVYAGYTFFNKYKSILDGFGNEVENVSSCISINVSYSYWVIYTETMYVSLTFNIGPQFLRTKRFNDEYEEISKKTTLGFGMGLSFFFNNKLKIPFSLALYQMDNIWFTTYGVAIPIIKI